MNDQAFCRPPPLPRESLTTIGAKMDGEGWHDLLLLSMGAAATLDADDWPVRRKKRPLEDGDVC